MFTKQDLAEAVLEGFQYTALSIYVVCYRRRYGLGTLSKFFGGRDLHDAAACIFLYDCVIIALNPMGKMRGVLFY